MRPLILVLIPIVFFAGALLTAGDSKPAQKKVLVPEAYPAYVPEEAASQDEEQNDSAQVSEEPAATSYQGTVADPPQAYVSVRKCTNAAGVVAYETAEGLQARIESERAQCDNPVAITRDGKNYFGCPSGKIILDCDWFVEIEGAETATENAVFGASDVVDFEVPDVSGMSCAEELVDPAELAEIGGNICDLERLVGNLNQMHGG
jgi:hypothetical protein